MHQELIERCAEALWLSENRDLANQYKYSKIFKRPGPFNWRDANDPDIIPNIANQFRDRAIIVIRETRRYLAKRVPKTPASKVFTEIYTILNE